jgi:hypothetical protein
MYELDRLPQLHGSERANVAGGCARRSSKRLRVSDSFCVFQKVAAAAPVEMSACHRPGSPGIVFGQPIEQNLNTF